MDYQKQRKRLAEHDQGLIALSKLLSQIEIIHRRALAGMEQSSKQDHLDNATRNLNIATLILDTESFYTVAADFLKLITFFLNDTERRSFERSRPYRTIMVIRNQRVRHAYEKPDGDLFSGFKVLPTRGPILKAFGPAPDPADDLNKGYTWDYADFWNLLACFGICGREQGQPRIRATLIERIRSASVTGSLQPWPHTPI